MPLSEHVSLTLYTTLGILGRVYMGAVCFLHNFDSLLKKTYMCTFVQENKICAVT